MFELVSTTRMSAFLLAVGSLALASPAFAEDIVVNSFVDAPDLDPNDGVCDADAAPGLQCTLRAAIMHANSTGEADVITLPAGTYKLTIKGSGEDASATGDLDVTLGSQITVQGAGAGVTIIDGKKAKDRIFDNVQSGTLILHDLTLQKGASPNGESGGGGVRSNGSTRIEDCVITKCKSKDDAGALDVRSFTTTVINTLFSKNKSKDDGGAIDVDGGTLIVSYCAFVKNSAKGEGGALESSGQTVTLLSTTFSANKAKGEGGAIVNEDGGTMTIEGCTLTKNQARKGSGLSTQDEGFSANDTRVSNTIFDNNKKTNCFGTFTSLGGNLDSGSSCGLGAGELSNTKPLLSPLADNGGATPTHALKSESPAIGAGNAAQCTFADQRQIERGTTCDIGAFETVELP